MLYTSLIFFFIRQLSRNFGTYPRRQTNSSVLEELLVSDPRVGVGHQRDDNATCSVRASRHGEPLLISVRLATYGSQATYIPVCSAYFPVICQLYLQRGSDTRIFITRMYVLACMSLQQDIVCVQQPVCCTLENTHSHGKNLSHLITAEICWFSRNLCLIVY